MRTLLTLLLSLPLMLHAQMGMDLGDPGFVGGLGAVAGGGGAPTPDILWWKMNTGSGTSIAGYASGGGDSGTTDASWVTGKSGSGYALDFNGTSQDSRSTATMTYGAGVLTVCAWVYLDVNTGSRVIWESTQNPNSFAATFTLFLDSGNLNAMIHGTSGYRSEYITAPSTGSWTHVAVVYDNSTTTGDVGIYIGGSSQSTTIGTNTKASSADFIAGYYFYAGARGQTSLFMDGRLDDLRIYSGDQSASLADIIADAQ